VFAAKAKKPENRWFIFRDESLNYDLFGAFEAKAHNTTRNLNVFCMDSLQAYDFEEPRVERDFRTNTYSVIFGNKDFEMAQECAKDLSGMFDEFHVHHTDVTTKQRVVHDTEQRVTEQVWEGPKGTKGKSTSTTRAPVTHHEDYEEKRD